MNSGMSGRPGVYGMPAEGCAAGGCRGSRNVVVVAPPLHVGMYFQYAIFSFLLLLRDMIWLYFIFSFLQLSPLIASAGFSFLRCIRFRAFAAEGGCILSFQPILTPLRRLSFIFGWSFHNSFRITPFQLAFAFFDHFRLSLCRCHGVAPSAAFSARRARYYFSLAGRLSSGFLCFFAMSAASVALQRGFTAAGDAPGCWARFLATRKRSVRCREAQFRRFAASHMLSLSAFLTTVTLRNDTCFTRPSTAVSSSILMFALHLSCTQLRL